MDKRLRQLAQAFLDRVAQGDSITMQQWCEQHPEDSVQLKGAIEELGYVDRTLDLHGTEPREIERTEPLTPLEPATEKAPEGPLFDNRYRICDTLGEGGFGKVYLVEDTFQNNERLALKLIKAEHQATESFAKRFQLEIRVLRALRHDGIPPIYNDGITSDGEIYFTMAYAPGRSLREILNSGKNLEPIDVANYIRQMVHILDYAHGEGVIHRDLKPGNVFIQAEGTPEAKVQILDFGIAKVLKKKGALESAVTMQTEAPIGTPHYMAPEQVRGQKIDGKTDLYALGVMIYRMVSGGYPFEGDTSMAVMAARLEAKPKPLPHDSKPEWAADLVRELLSNEADMRPGTKEIREFLEAGKVIRKGQKITHGMLAAGLLGIGLLGWGAYALSQQKTVEEPNGDAQKQAAQAGTDPQQAVGDQGTQLSPTPGTTASSEGQATEHPEPPGPATIQLTPPASELRQSTRAEVEFAGQVSGIAENEILVQGQSTRLDADGHFRTQLTLAEGERTVEFRDPEGNLLLSQPVWVDLSDPTLDLVGATEGIVTSAESWRVQGQARDAFGLQQTLCNGDPLPLDDSGHFDIQVPIESEGEQTIRLQAIDRAGRSTTASIQLRVDRTPPTVTFDELLPSQASQPTYRLSGQVHEADLASTKLTRDGKPIELDAKGQFRTGLPLAIGRNEFTLEAVDGVGLTWKKTFAIERAAAAAFTPDGCTPAPDASIEAGWANAVIHAGTGMRLRYVPGAGSAPAFYLGTSEVTREQYGKFADSLAGEAQEPVANITYAEAQTWCERAGLELPTETQWIRAAGAATYPWGADWDPAKCNAGFNAGADHFAGASPVNALEGDVNELGIAGLAGNVSEWVQGATGPRLMGGSFRDRNAELFVTNKPRSLGRLPSKKDSIGFRAKLPASRK